MGDIEHCANIKSTARCFMSLKPCFTCLRLSNEQISDLLNDVLQCGAVAITCLTYPKARHLSVILTTSRATADTVIV